MQKHLVVLFIVAAALGLAGVAGAQSPDPTDDTLPDPTETTLPTDPEGDSDEEVPTTTESTTTESTTTTSTTSTTTTTSAPTTVPQPELASDPPAEVAGLQQDACDPNYAGACVPISVTDLDCDDIDGTDIQVVGSDPHGLDGNDNDGLACESGSRAGTGTPVSATSSAAPDKLAATGSSSEQRYLLSLALVVAGLFAILISAAIAPEIVVPRRGGFTVTKVNHAGDEIRTRITGARTDRRSRR